MSSQKIIVVLFGLLLAVVAAAAVVIWLLPSPDTEPSSVPEATTTPASGDGFNTSVLQRPEYLKLNQQLIREGALPVQPPTTAGKVNPFL